MITKDTYALDLTDIPEEIMVTTLRAVQPEKIICFGKLSETRETWSWFLHSSIRQTSIAFDLLIVTRPDEKRYRHDIPDMLDGFKTTTITINTLTHNFNITTGNLLSDRAGNSIPMPCRMPAPGEIKHGPFKFITQNL